MNVKPADLAYIVRSRNAENLGATVEVIEFHGVDEEGVIWTCNAARPLLMTNGRRMADRIQIPDARLRPISGVPMTDEVNEEEKLPCTV